MNTGMPYLLVSADQIRIVTLFFKTFQGGVIMSEKRDAYVRKMKAKLDQWSADIDMLKAKISEASAEKQIEYKQRMEKLREKRKELEQKLAEMEKAGESTWENFKQSTEASWEALKEGFAAAKAAYKRESEKDKQ
jgi:regulator of replication initiation timing